MDNLSQVVASNIIRLRAEAGLSRLALASDAGIGQDAPRHRACLRQFQHKNHR